MGGMLSGYLDAPVTDIEIEDGVSKLGLKYGGGSMQGWRNANEDMLSCLPDMTEDSALFGVYDGHGGGEIAQYVAKYLPMLLKTHYAFTSGKMEQALKAAFLAVDKQITLEETVDELQTLAGTKADDEDENDPEEKLKECHDLHEEAALPLADLLAKYKRQMQDCVEEERREAEEFEGSGKGKKQKGSADDGGEDEEAGVAAAAAVEGAVQGAVQDAVEDVTKEEKPGENGTVAKSSEGNGTSNGSAGASNGDVDEEDEEYEASEEEEDEEDDEEEGDDDEDDDDDSSEEESEAGDIPPCDEREGYGSGTTACVAVIKHNVVTVANVGDSRCVLSTGGVAKDLSVDHKPEDEIELTRIVKAGGKLSKDGRVNGGLNLSRALGDHQYKANTDLPPEDQMISPFPDIQTHEISKDDEFLLLACDGIWNVLSSQEAVDFVKEHLSEAKENATCKTTWLSDISGKLMNKCLAKDCSGDGTGCDNMTCVVVLLNQDTTAKRKLAPETETNNKKLKTS